MDQATGSHGYTGKTHLRGFENLDFPLVRVGGLGLYGSAISNRQRLVQDMRNPDCQRILTLITDS